MKRWILALCIITCSTTVHADPLNQAGISARFLMGGKSSTLLVGTFVETGGMRQERALVSISHDRQFATHLQFAEEDRNGRNVLKIVLMAVGIAWVIEETSGDAPPEKVGHPLN